MDAHDTPGSPPRLWPALVRPLVLRALAEDLGGRDITTEAIGGADAVPARARILARGATVVCGLEVAAETFRALDERAVFTPLVVEGQAVEAGRELARISAPAPVILAAERVALNLLAHLCGVAARTRQFVEAVAATNCRILDTRKTLPGLRAVQKYAVRCGGGVNHRHDLADHVLLKENHLLLAGGVEAAVAACRKVAGPGIRIEIEVETLEQLDEALARGIDAVLLDNMPAAVVAEAVRRARAAESAQPGRRVQLEASGDMTLERARQMAEAGVDFVSVGALTHSVTAANLSLLLESGASWEAGAVSRQLAAALVTRSLGRNAVVRHQIDSTNRLGRTLAAQADVADGTVVLAHEQTAGYGRRGREWRSPAGRGLYASLVLRPNTAPATAALLGQVFALAVHEALARHAVGVELKWPNDFLVGERKLGGVLIEGNIQGGVLSSVVIGLGLNLTFTSDDLPQRPLFPATSMAMEGGVAPAAPELLAAILNAFEPRYQRWRSQADADTRTWAREVEAILAFRGRRVRISSAQGQFDGRLLGLGDAGELRLEVNGSERLFVEGDLLLVAES